MTNHPRPFGNNIAEIKQGVIFKTDTVNKQISFLHNRAGVSDSIQLVNSSVLPNVHPAQPVIASPNASPSSCLFSAACLGHTQTSQGTPGGQLNQAHSREETEWLR